MVVRCSRNQTGVCVWGSMSAEASASSAKSFRSGLAVSLLLLLLENAGELVVAHRLGSRHARVLRLVDGRNVRPQPHQLTIRTVKKKKSVFPNHPFSHHYVASFDSLLIFSPLRANMRDGVCGVK